MCKTVIHIPVYNNDLYILCLQNADLQEEIKRNMSRRYEDSVNLTYDETQHADDRKTSCNMYFIYCNIHFLVGIYYRKIRDDDFLIEVKPKVKSTLR